MLTSTLSECIQLKYWAGEKRLLLYLLLWIFPWPLYADEIEIELKDGSVAPIVRYPASGDTLLIWLPSEFGSSKRLNATAESLAAQGLETWLVDLHATWFIPVGRYSLQDISIDSLLEILQQAQQRSAKKVFIVAPGRVAAKALQTIHLWQESSLQNGQLGGAILFHPKLYTQTPQGGEKATFLPIATATNIPIYIFQPENSAHYWRSRTIRQTLTSGGAPVFLHDLADVSDGFNIRPDFTEVEEIVTRQLPEIIAQAIARLQDYEVPLQANKLGKVTSQKPGQTDSAALLKPYTAKTKTPELELKTLNGETINLTDYKNQVVVLNFWATWCPPCVEEIPSLERLKTLRQDQGLAVISVDVGEPPETIQEFLSDKPITFPVLLDPDASAFKAWNNYAFPTTFILDHEHKIRYARFGAFAWDSEEVLTAIDGLLKPINNKSRPEEVSKIIAGKKIIKNTE